MSGSSDKKYVSKRVKVKTVPFEPDVPVSPSKRKSAGGGEVKDLLYHRNAFLAVRNDEGLTFCFILSCNSKLRLLLELHQNIFASE